MDLQEVSSPTGVCTSKCKDDFDMVVDLSKLIWHRHDGLTMSILAGGGGNGAAQKLLELYPKALEMELFHKFADCKLVRDYVLPRNGLERALTASAEHAYLACLDVENIDLTGTELVAFTRCWNNYGLVHIVGDYTAIRFDLCCENPREAKDIIAKTVLSGSGIIATLFEHNGHLLFVSNNILNGIGGIDELTDIMEQMVRDRKSTEEINKRIVEGAASSNAAADGNDGEHFTALHLPNLVMKLKEREPPINFTPAAKCSLCAASRSHSPQENENEEPNDSGRSGGEPTENKGRQKDDDGVDESADASRANRTGPDDEEPAEDKRQKDDGVDASADAPLANHTGPDDEEPAEDKGQKDDGVDDSRTRTGTGKRTGSDHEEPAENKRTLSFEQWRAEYYAGEGTDVSQTNSTT